ncbi:MAG: hypothetical protein QXX41_02840 [Nitrososphaerota archaeon]
MSVFWRMWGLKDVGEFSVKDVMSFLDAVRSPLYGRSGPVYECKVVAVLLKFLRSIGATIGQEKVEAP